MFCIVTAPILLLLWLFSVESVLFDCLKYSELVDNASDEYNYERCDSSKQGCIQLTVLPSYSTPQKQFYGCLDYEHLGSDAKSICEANMWVPRYDVIINEKQFVGQMLCCLDVDMCNECKMIPIEGIYNEDDQDDLIFMIEIGICTVAIFIYPILLFSKFVYKTIKKTNWEFVEMGKSIDLMADCDMSLYKNQGKFLFHIIVDGKIPTLLEVRSIYEIMRRPRITNENIPSFYTQQKNPLKIFVSKQFFKASNEIVSKIKSTNTRFASLLFEMLIFGPTTLRIKPHNMVSIFADLYEIVSHEPSLIELPSSDEYLIIGDLRGEYRDLHRWFRINGYPPTKKIIVLGGMIMTENVFSLETFLFLAVLKLTLPQHVYLLRGATESLEIKIALTDSWKISNAITTVVINICERLPLAATIGSRIYCVHSGISPLATTLKKISEIDRKKQRTELSQLLCHMMFSEPSSTVEMFKPMKIGRGLLFGPKAIAEFCKKNNLDLIIRAHNPISQGFFLGANRKLLSIWSTPGYNSCEFSATVLVHADMSVEIVQMSS